MRAFDLQEVEFGMQNLLYFLVHSGLFHKVIQQSGTPLCQWGFHTPEKAYQNARDLAVNLGFDGVGDAALVAFLRNAPVEEMVRKTLQVDYVCTIFNYDIPISKMYE